MATKTELAAPPEMQDTTTAGSIGASNAKMAPLGIFKPFEGLQFADKSPSVNL